jgi:hypothetical protein
MRVDDVFRTEFVDALVELQNHARLMPGVLVMNGEPLAIDNERRAAERFYDQWVAPVVAEREIALTQLREADQILLSMRLDLDDD